MGRSRCHMIVMWAHLGDHRWMTAWCANWPMVDDHVQVGGSSGPTAGSSSTGSVRLVSVP
jgi:hypothetical protein